MITSSKAPSPNEAPRAALSIKEWCDSVGISTQLFFKIPAKNRPRSFLVGRRRLITISASNEWIARREAEALSVTA